MTKNEKIEILTEVLNVYKNKIHNNNYSKSFHFGMCSNLEFIISKHLKESPTFIYVKGLHYYIPEFARHEKYGHPVLWFKITDYQSRINYLLETIKIIENN